MSAPLLDKHGPCCLTCMFFARRDEHGGFCRRYPPTPRSLAGAPVPAAQPLVDKRLWCGEWQHSPLDYE